MAESRRYDIVIIGGGIGGYITAIRSTQLGKKVALMEKDQLGGICLNWGCIPTKTLLTITDFLSKVERAEEFGVHLGNVTIDFKKVIARKDAVVSRLIKGIRFLIKKNNIKIINGKGKVLSKNQVSVLKSDGSTDLIDAENIVIATGSNNSKPSYVEIDEERVLTCRGALRLTEVPKSLTIIGGDIIGIEFAVIFHALGVDVKILERGLTLLPSLDKDLGQFYQRVLNKKGFEVHLETEVRSAEIKSDGKVRISALKRDSLFDIETEKVLFIDKREPLTNDLGLEKVGVQMKDGFIVVNEHMRTSIPNIYAVGDVTGGKMLAHVAAAEGIVAAENIAELESTIEYKTVPKCMYCKPEVASVGLSEDEAKEQGYKVAVGKFPLLANARALTLGEPEGFAKVICDGGTGEILGVHLIGPHVTDLIAEASLAMHLECTSEEIGSLVHVHPTISEAFMEAARAVSDKAIHI